MVKVSHGLKWKTMIHQLSGGLLKRLKLQDWLAQQWVGVFDLIRLFFRTHTHMTSPIKLDRPQSLFDSYLKNFTAKLDWLDRTATLASERASERIKL